MRVARSLRLSEILHREGLQSERGHESDFLRIARNGMTPVPWRRGLGSGPNARQERGGEKVAGTYIMQTSISL
jgi:hypothetical protein